MAKRTFLIYIAFISAFFVASCASEEIECPDDTIPNMKIGMEQSTSQDVDTFIVYNTQLSDDLYFDYVVPDTFSIPLDLTASKTYLNLGIKYSDSSNFITDTLLLMYDQTVQLNNLECGFITTFELSMATATTHFIDSIEILNSTVNSIDQNHVKIYY